MGACYGSKKIVSRRKYSTNTESGEEPKKIDNAEDSPRTAEKFFEEPKKLVITVGPILAKLREVKKRQAM